MVIGVLSELYATSIYIQRFCHIDNVLSFLRAVSIAIIACKQFKIFVWNGASSLVKIKATYVLEQTQEVVADQP